jgi:hypothetical protein
LCVGFKSAADHVKDANIKKNFQEYAQQREKFSKELQEHVKKCVTLSLFSSEPTSPCSVTLC